MRFSKCLATLLYLLKYQAQSFAYFFYTFFPFMNPKVALKHLQKAAFYCGHFVRTFGCILGGVDTALQITVDLCIPEKELQ
jgi:hypothetical protein